MRMGQGVRTGLGHGGIICVLQTQFSSFFFHLFHLHYSSDFAAFCTFTIKAYCHVLSNRVAAEVVNNIADRYRYELNL